MALAEDTPIARRRIRVGCVEAQNFVIENAQNLDQ